MVPSYWNVNVTRCWRLWIPDYVAFILKKIPKFQIKTFLVFCEIQRTEKKRYLLIIVIGVKDNCLFRYVLQNDTPHRISYDVFVKFLAIFLNHFLFSIKENNNWIPQYWYWKFGLNVNIFYNIRIEMILFPT